MPPRPPPRLPAPSVWPRIAAAVGTALGPERWHEDVRAWLERRPRGSWGVALSGGADSVALLLALWAAFPQRRARLVALHFDHRLRGRASRADASFCRKLCAALGVRCAAGVWTRGPRQASEAEARTARHDFFVREYRRRRLAALWLAHQQDDVAETLLMRVARGSGTAGLAAPRPVHVLADGRTHLRPFLTLRKSVLVDALRTAGAVWREDASNDGDAHFRNRVRRRVLPAWAAAAGRDAVAGAGLSRDLLAEDDAALETWLDELKPLDPRGRLDCSRLAGRPRAIWRRALHRWLMAVWPEGRLSRQGFAQLLGRAEQGADTRFSLGAEGFAVLRGGRLSFRRTGSRVE